MYFTQVVKNCNDYTGRAVEKKGSGKVYSGPVIYLQCTKLDLCVQTPNHLINNNRVKLLAQCDGNISGLGLDVFMH